MMYSDDDNVDYMIPFMIRIMMIITSNDDADGDDADGNDGHCNMWWHLRFSGKHSYQLQKCKADTTF